MNNDKAKEFFSAYEEGTLDPGLRQSLDQRLRSSSELQEDYRGFEGTLDELNSMKFETVEVPFDLHERISARLDRHIYDQKQAAKPSWNLWLRNAGIAGLAAAAVFGAVMGINSRGDHNLSGVIPGSVATDLLTVNAIPNGVVLQYKPSVQHIVTVTSGPGGQVLGKFNVGSDGWANNLENGQPETALFNVDITSELPKIIAVPGLVRQKATIGQGTIQEFVRSLAGVYRTPVVLKTQHPDQTISWKLTENDALAAASTALGSQRFRLEMHTSGVLWIEENN